MSGKDARLLNRNFVLLWQGQLVSQVGSQAFLVALLYWTMEATGSASLMGILMMVSALPSVLLGAVGGTLADRYSRKSIIVWADFLSGLSVLLLAMLFFTPGASIQILTAALFVTAVLTGTIQAFFRPAILAAVPDLVPISRVPAANSMIQFVFQFGTILGQGAGGVAYALVGAPLLFLFDGLSFLFSAASETFIQLPGSSGERSGEARMRWNRFYEDLVEGLRFVWRRTGLKNFLILVGFVNFFAMPLLVLMPFLVQQNLGRGAEWFGILLAAFSAGSVVGYLVAGTIRISPGNRARLLVAILVMAGGAIVALSWITRPELALLLMLVTGVGLGIFNINVMTLFQMAAGRDLRGRVMGLVLAIASAASPFGMALGGLAADLSGHNIQAILTVCGGGIILVVLAMGLRRPVLEFLAS